METHRTLVRPFPAQAIPSFNRICLDEQSPPKIFTVCLFLSTDLASEVLRVTSRFGLTFGLTLCGMTHASVSPMMGLTEKPEDQPPCEHASELVTHAI
jgi:hypothetical protein